jgi:hypothetical protein
MRKDERDKLEQIRKTLKMNIDDLGVVYRLFIHLEKQIHNLITADILKKQKDEAEKPGPAHLREEVSPQEWKEPSSTGRERGGQNAFALLA